jgi:hypothetical protein
MVRPAALLRGMGEAGGSVGAVLEPLRGVEMLRWDAWAREDGMIEGEIRLRVVPER